ncbi:MAG TPA: TetR/AcrR family transcriptional regulator C-terminal domain-containing protein, partial [Stellaceae bacterium]|nr:TetR/AcrR family transcriptional regulator C-terminal domain-containing protein [Stellaceae bacterium]
PNPAGMFEGGTLEEILERLARYILRAALTPQALALHRVILAEATRFPELAAVVAEQGGGREAVQRIAALLERERATGGIGIADTIFAATQFLQMVVAAPQRRALGMGPPMSEAEIDRWAAGSVRLFLRGCRA